jgi:hypothetical protein
MVWSAAVIFAETRLRTTVYKSFESNSQAFSFASAAYRWDIRFCWLINCLRSKGCAVRKSTGKGGLPFLLCPSQHKSVLHTRRSDPSLGSGKIRVSEFQEGKAGQPSEERGQHTEISRPSGRHNLARRTPLEEDGILAGASAERERADRRGRLVFVCCEEVVQACVTKGV